MKSVKKTAAEGNNRRELTPEARKKRVHRIKSAIIITIIFFMLLPTLLCILLGIRLFRLQKQIDDLINIHITDGTLPESQGDEYAYAAEIEQEQINARQTDKSPDNSESLRETGSHNNSPSFPDEFNEADDSVITSQDSKGDKLSDGIRETEGPEIEATSPEGTQPTPDDQEAGGDNQIDSGLINGAGQDNLKETPEFPAVGLEEFRNSQENEGLEEPLHNEAGADYDSQHHNNPETDEKQGKYYGKTVYLTFDDGPSKHTDEILDILAEYDVKATFFVNGRTDKESKRQFIRIVDEGHTLGMHSYSHAYKEIYNSVEDFDKDFTKLWKLLYDTTGYMPTIYRFPGGSYNKVNDHGMDDFIRYLNEKSIVYYDWNVVNGDATGEKLTRDQMLDNVLSGVSKKKTAMVLMHDTRSNNAMVASLPMLLTELLEQGAKILPIDESVRPIQQIKADSIK